MICWSININILSLLRVLRDDPTKSDMHNRQGLNFKMILSVIGDWRLWPIYALGLTHMGAYLLKFIVHLS
jgi:hypothetical protein